MRFVAFLRNVNLGRPPAPTRVQLELAFVFAGAPVAQSFQTNGTIAFDAREERHAESIVHGACAELRRVCGLKEPAFLRSMASLVALVERDPFESVHQNAVYGCYVTFLHEAVAFGARPPRWSQKRDVHVVEYAPSELLSVAYKVGRSPGSPNAFAEQHFGLPATTRSWGTLGRLVRRRA